MRVHAAQVEPQQVLDPLVPEVIDAHREHRVPGASIDDVDREARRQAGGQVDHRVGRAPPRSSVGDPE